MKKSLVSIALIAAAALTVTGCTQTAPKAFVFKPTEKSGLIEFAKIANKSCKRANAIGSVQRGEDKSVLIMVPKSKAIKGFSAAYHDKKAGYGLIYENDAFYACGIANQITMYSENGADINTAAGAAQFEQYTLINTDEQPNTFDVTVNYNGTEIREQYIVENGLIVRAANVSKGIKKPVGYSVGYGYTAKDLKILQTAVARNKN